MNVLFITNRPDSGLKPYSSPGSDLEVGVYEGLLPLDYRNKVRRCVRGNHYDAVVAYADTESVVSLLDSQFCARTGRCKLRVVTGDPAKIKKYLERYSKYTGKPITA